MDPKNRSSEWDEGRPQRSTANELVTGTKLVTADDEVDPPAADAPSADGHGRGGKGGVKRAAEGRGAQ